MPDDPYLIQLGARLADRPLRRGAAAGLVFAAAALVILPATVRNRIVGGECLKFIVCSFEGKFGYLRHLLRKLHIKSFD